MAQTTDNGTPFIFKQARIVWGLGDLFKGTPKKDNNTGQLVKDDQGNQVTVYGFGLAIPKSSPQTTEIFNIMQAEARKIYPSGQFPPDFAWKMKDGDRDLGPDGAPLSQREGYAGHYVFACTTQLPIKWFRWENGVNQLVNEGIKVGDYVEAQVMIKGHAPAGRGKAGLYMNPSAVRFNGYGTEIKGAGGVNANEVFGTAAPDLASGASATPVAPAGGFPTQPVPGFGGPVAGAQQPMGSSGVQGSYPASAPAPAAAMAPQAPAQPHWGVVPQNFQPPQQAMMPGSAPGAAAPYGGVPQQFPAPANGAAPLGQAPATGMPGPTGFHPGGAPMAAFPGNPFPQQ